MRYTGRKKGSVRKIISTLLILAGLALVGISIGMIECNTIGLVRGVTLSDSALVLMLIGIWMQE